jgi:hypothetical protein
MNQNKKICNNDRSINIIATVASIASLAFCVSSILADDP